MLEKVNYNIAAHPLKNVENKPTEIKQSSFQGTTAIASETSNAARAYGEALINKPAEQLSLKENILLLKSRGKIEGKDYKIDVADTGNTFLTFYNKNGQIIKDLSYDKDDTNKPCFWVENKYTNGKLTKEIFHDMNGRIRHYSNCYYNEEIPQENFTKEKITYKTTPQEYIEYLKNNKKNFKVEYEGEEKDTATYISEYDENDNLIQTTHFYPKSIIRSIYNQDCQETHSIMFNNESTEICTYLEKWSKTKNILRRDVPQETFTKEHITAETTPEKYIKYLQDNNIEFKIKEINQRQAMQIIVKDSNGSQKCTLFEVDNQKLTPVDTVIMREEIDKNGNGKRIQFSKTSTCINNFSYD